MKNDTLTYIILYICYLGSKSEVIYTLPNKTKTAVKTHHTDPLIDKRTIVVNSVPGGPRIDVHDGIESPPRNTRSPVNSPNSNYHSTQRGANTMPHHSGSTPVAIRKPQTPVMHEEARDDRNVRSYTQSSQSHDSGATTNQGKIDAKSLTGAEVGSEFELGSVVEVTGNPENCKYGVIRWIGYLKEKSKPIVGLEMVSVLVPFLSIFLFCVHFCKFIVNLFIFLLLITIFFCGQ